MSAALALLAGLLQLGIPVQALHRSTVPGPVRWHAEATAPTTPVGAAEFRATVTATVAPGWHLYAMDEPEAGPIALEFRSPAEGPAALVSVGADRPSRGVAAGTSEAASYYVGEAHFILRLRWRGTVPAGPVPVTLAVQYQACNDRMCLPPLTETLAFQVNAGSR